MHEKITKVCETVLERVTPKQSERAKIEALAKTLREKVADASKALDVEAEVRVEGSVAKDTWLSEEPEIDIFMRVPTTIPRKDLGEKGLEIARRATRGSKQIERFAEHPYLEAFIKGVRVNIVPCYNVKKREWQSATDRTPYHTDYMKTRLNAKMRGEVRLLKKLMKGIGVYGAEIRIGGFSGYLCELLILHHKTFIETLEAFSTYEKRIIVDIEDFYRGRENELQLLFKEPLVIVDPVDKGRNVSSAVRPEKLYTLVAAARAFLKNPNLSFFYPPKTTALTAKELQHKLTSLGSTIVFLTFGRIDAVPDVLWGQLYKSQRSLNKLMQLNDFTVLRSLPWSEEKSLNVFVFELEQRFLIPLKKHLGPPLERKHECEKFLAKYLSNSDVASGPYIEDGRWVVELRRKYTDVVALLSDTLKNGGRRVGVAELISRKMDKGFKILVNNEIMVTYETNSRFAEFLTEFLSGKPKWLKFA